MQRKLLCATLIVATLGFGGCGSIDNAGSAPNTESNTTVENAEIEPADQENQQGDIKTENAEATIDEQVVYEQDGIKITAKGLDSDSSFMGTELKLLIENDSEKNITVQARNVSVNGYMVDSNMSAEVAAKKKSNDSLTFLSSSFETCGIEQIAEMEFNFHIFNSDSWEDSIDSDMILIKTSCADSYVQKYDDSGDVIYEDSSIKIISKGLSEDSSFMGPSLVLYIENNSDKGLTVQARDTSINGFMLDATLSPEITSGKKTIASMIFLDSDIQENQIENIENIETSFHIFNSDDWSDAIDTDIISVEF